MIKLDALIAVFLLLGISLTASGVYQLVGAGYATLTTGTLILTLALLALRGISK